MNTTPVSHTTALSGLKLFFALSRTPHGLVDMATPALAALLALGAFPSLKIMILGLLTTFAGYTAVYALNDVIDCPVDKKKLQRGGFQESGDYLDAVMMRHPLAQGALSFRAGVFWVLAWSLLTLIGAYMLNPVCVFIFAGGCILETVYCLMWRTSHLRTIVSGVVKTSGAIAAVFAVTPDPNRPFLITLFLWLFFWEIGGQNVPADWTDIEEDQRLQATTIPVRLGVESANVIILSCLTVAILLNVALFRLIPGGLDHVLAAAALVVGLYLLFIPAYRLYSTKERGDATALFNKASYYPLVLLVLVIIRLVL
jgi:4-hydroxybenzoate polyprenyltransferase